MAEIDVKLLGTLRKLTGGKAIHLSLEGELRIFDVIQRLAVDLDPSFKGFLGSTDHGSPYHVLILVRGFEIGALRGGDTPVSDGDEVVILPVAHGG